MEVASEYTSPEDKAPIEETAMTTRDIYCYGPLLHEAQFAKIYLFNDSKTFVDMAMKFGAGEILRKFRILTEEIRNLPPAEKDAKLKEFIYKYLSSDEGLIEWTPDDWTECPPFLENVQDSNLKFWGRKLNLLWKKLGRKMGREGLAVEDRRSLIYCSNPFVIPGGRFREFYYWDNYWINRGLLLCKMHDTVKGTIRNFFEMVDRFRFVPNGARVYYTGRSQPPFLTLMVRDYVKDSGNDEFILEALPYLEKEYSFWEKERTVEVLDDEGQSYRLSRHASDMNLPRPESYKEDYELINQEGMGKDAQLTLMTHITSACESGWDFSSRWTGEQYDGLRGNELLLKIKTRDIIPVDLNSLLSAVERQLAEFNHAVGNTEHANMFRENYQRRVQAMEKFMWNRDDGCYYDYIMSKKSQNRQYFISNVTPLWTKTYPDNIDVAERDKAMHNYLKNQAYRGTPLLDLPGGIPISLNDCGQQWDFPNVWPPSAHMVIEGMYTSDVAELKEEGFRQAQKYVKVAWNGFLTHHYAMFEKYDAQTDDGTPGSGGEYNVQEGFGWTNGVAIIFLDEFGDRLSSCS